LFNLLSVLEPFNFGVRIINLALELNLPLRLTLLILQLTTESKGRISSCNIYRLIHFNRSSNNKFIGQARSKDAVNFRSRSSDSECISLASPKEKVQFVYRLSRST